MRDKLRKNYQVQKEVTRNGCFEGEISLSETERLGELLHGSESDQKGRKIAVSFEFSRNEYGIPMIMGGWRPVLNWSVNVASRHWNCR